MSDAELLNALAARASTRAAEAGEFALHSIRYEAARAALAACDASIDEWLVRLRYYDAGKAAATP